MQTFEEHNLLWLNESFLKPYINKEHNFLYKYFSNSPNREVMEYIYVMGKKYIYYFTDHTGIKAKAPFLAKQFNKFKNLMSIYNKAKTELDLETLKNLELGKMKFRKFLEANVN